MQSVNRQIHELPIGEQFFPQQTQQHQHPPGIGPQIFSPQLLQARLQQQQGGLVQDVHGIEKNQNLQNVYLLKQKLEAANAAFGQQQVPQRQSQTQQMLNNGSQNATSAALGSLAGLPPGVGMVQHGTSGMGPPSGAIHPQLAMGSFSLPPPTYFVVREVWSNNLHAEFMSIRKLVDQYNYVSISTEFVGTIARPMGNFRSKNDYHYQTMRANVDLLNPVQIGISLSDANGNKPENKHSTWQFNFHFDVTKEMVSAESLELLKKSGINFERHQNFGVLAFEFAQLLIDSGLISDNVTWVSYHAAYDFGFLVNMLMNNSMPNNKEDYVWWVQQFVPNFYDLNLINKFSQQHPSQLQQQHQPQFTLETMADELGIPRFSLFSSTAGQSLLALLTFTTLLNLPLPQPQLGPDLTRYKNMIYGITNE
ncbi:CCR4-NOT core DEDD family RNase subunit POP2 [Lachancea thermotolerans CBS 6340]|uniref:poly(A)-specific ribonuclease n=1 Tax=Lachancea thermotolerans (strain ATCC 56472 / CBS 6340 / NRRL Y-8284) TaxID=559295 RepID=C5DC43_LACTC|nr:KLTH0A07656p [Lachancea thermotolerans CBS 6340]CAR21350.1 KLTH0A07656p [Lachancea thermotolerans CBS 6340]